MVSHYPIAVQFREQRLVLSGLCISISIYSMEQTCLIYSLTLVDISLGVVRCLVLLVDNGILCGGSTAAKAGIRVLGDVLVGLLGCLGTTALDGLSDVVNGVLVSDISI